MTKKIQVLMSAKKDFVFLKNYYLCAVADNTKENQARVEIKVS